jgi:hypothetical protein
VCACRTVCQHDVTRQLMCWKRPEGMQHGVCCAWARTQRSLPPLASMLLHISIAQTQQLQHKHIHQSKIHGPAGPLVTSSPCLALAAAAVHRARHLQAPSCHLDSRRRVQAGAAGWRSSRGALPAPPAQAVRHVQHSQHHSHLQGMRVRCAVPRCLQHGRAAASSSVQPACQGPLLATNHM